MTYHTSRDGDRADDRPGRSCGHARAGRRGRPDAGRPGRKRSQASRRAIRPPRRPRQHGECLSPHTSGHALGPTISRPDRGQPDGTVPRGPCVGQGDAHPGRPTTGIKGKIVILGDWATERPYKDYLPYLVAKGGLTTLTPGAGPGAGSARSRRSDPARDDRPAAGLHRIRKTSRARANAACADSGRPRTSTG